MDIHNSILNYHVTIDRTTTNKYLLGKNAATPSFYTTTQYDISLNSQDTTSDKNLTVDPITNIDLSKNTLNSNDMFLWPDSTYEYLIKTKNSLGYETPIGISSELITPAPDIPNDLYWFLDSNNKLDTLVRDEDIKDSGANYANNGFLTKADITENTIFNATDMVNEVDSIEVTRKIGTTHDDEIPTNITSHTTHIINITSIQSNTPAGSEQLSNAGVSWTDSGVINANKDSNEAVFKIWNVAADPQEEVFKIGTAADFSIESGDNNDLFDITRSDRIDAYKHNPNYEDRNYGYWYVEDVQYNINFTKTSGPTTNINVRQTDDLYRPLKYELRCYYNEDRTDTTDWSKNIDASANTIILENSDNSGNYIYFDDKCTNTPNIVENTSN